MNIEILRNFFSNVDSNNYDSIEMKMIEKLGNGIIAHTPQLTKKRENN